MEVRDYLRVHRRRAVGVLLLPLVAAAVTAAVTTSRPAQHTGSVVVTVPPPATESGASLLRFADDFSTAVVTSAVVDRVAAATGAPRREVREGVEVRRLGGGGRLRVLMTGEDPVEVGEVAASAARETLGELSRPAVEVARAAVPDVQRRYEEAEARLQAFSARTGLVAPPQRVQSLLVELGDLTARIAQEEAAGEPERAVTARATLVRRQADLETARGLVPEYLALDAAVDEAQAPLDRAREDLREAEVALLAGGLPSAVSPVTVVQVPVSRTVLQPVAVAAGAALFLGVGLLVLLDLLLPRRSRGRPGVTGGVEDTDGVVAPLAVPASRHRAPGRQRPERAQDLA